MRGVKGLGLLTDLIESRERKCVNSIVFIRHQNFHWTVHHHDLTTFNTQVVVYDSLASPDARALPIEYHDQLAAIAKGTRPRVEELSVVGRVYLENGRGALTDIRLIQDCRKFSAETPSHLRFSQMQLRVDGGLSSSPGACSSNSIYHAMASKHWKGSSSPISSARSGWITTVQSKGCPRT